MLIISAHDTSGQMNRGFNFDTLISLLQGLCRRLTNKAA